MARTTVRGLYWTLRASVPPAWLSPELEAALSEVAKRPLGRGWIPGVGLVFRALSYFPPSACRVVILGQDPYPDPGKANGLAFGVADTYARSRIDSLAAIEAETGASIDRTLVPWARQGVLLLNAILSTRPREPLAHRDRGWEGVTHAILDQVPDSAVYLVLGGKARDFLEARGAMPSRSIVVGHPSPLARAARGSLPPFRGSACFARVNELLRQASQDEIVW